MQLAVVPLQERDVQLIPEFTKTMVKPEIFPLTTFSCAGYPSYLHAGFRIPPHSRETHFTGVYSGNECKGFAEWRRFDSILFLNNFYLDPEIRKFGLGSQLLDCGIQYARQWNADSIMLDVFDWNTPVMEWYAQKGFQPAETIHWHTGNNPFVLRDNETHNENLSQSDFWIKDYAAAEAHQKAYSFSSFTAITGKGRYSVGRIGNHVFRLRIDSPDLDEQLLQGLAHLDGHRSLLALSKSERIQGFSRVCSSIRMQLSSSGYRS